MANDIIQTIVLAGQDDVIQGLESIGEAGTTAFEAIQTAASGISVSSLIEGITGVAAAAGIAAAGMVKWAEASAHSIVEFERLAAISGTTVEGIAALSSAMTRLSGDSDGLGTRIRYLARTTEEQWGAIQKAWRNADTEQQASRERVERSAEAQKEAEVKAADAQITTQQKLQATRLAVADAQVKLQFEGRELALQQVQDAATVESAEANLQAAQLNLAESYGPVSEGQKKIVQQQLAGAAVTEAEIKLAQAKLRQQEDSAKRAYEYATAELDYNRAVKAAREEAALASTKLAEAETRRQIATTEHEAAVHAEQERVGNDIRNLKQYYEDLSKGVEYTGPQIVHNTQNAVRGIIAAIGPGGTNPDTAVGALKDFGGNLGEIGLRAPSFSESIFKIADVFKNLHDDTEKTALSVALFGRGVSPVFVQALSGGSDAVKAMIDHLKDLGLTFSSVKDKGHESDEFISNTFVLTLARLSEDVKTVGTQFGLLFAPSFTEIMRTIAEIIEQNRVSILGWGKTIVDAVNPVLAALVKFTTGVDLAKQLKLDPNQILSEEKWVKTFEDIRDVALAVFQAIEHAVSGLAPVVTAAIKSLTGIDLASLLHLSPEQVIKEQEWVATFEHIKTTVESAFGNVTAVLRTVSAAVQLVLVPFNAIAHTDFTPLDAGILAIGARFLGLGEPIKFVLTNLGKFAAALAFIDPPLTLIIAGITALIYAATHWDAVVSGVRTAWDTITGIIKTAIETARTRLADSWDAVWGGFKDAALKAVGSVRGIFEAAVSSVKSVFVGAFNGLIEEAIAAWEKVKSLLGIGTPSSTSKPQVGGGAAAAPTPVQGYATGGTVGGKLGHDANLGALTSGEYVMSKGAVDHYGTSFMNSVNAQGYAEGGEVGGEGSRRRRRRGFHPGFHPAAGSFESRAGSFEPEAGSFEPRRGSFEPDIFGFAEGGEVDDGKRKFRKSIAAKDSYLSEGFAELKTGVSEFVSGLSETVRSVGTDYAKGAAKHVGPAAAILGAGSVLLGLAHSPAAELVAAIMMSVEPRALPPEVAAAQGEVRATGSGGKSFIPSMAEYNEILSAAKDSEAVLQKYQYSFGEGEKEGGFAEGGVVYGKPGKDTNLALMTAGEFVMKADAVQHYGANMMHAINSMNFPKLDIGGMIRLPSPTARYADGGSVGGNGGGGGGSSRNFTLVLGSKQFDNLTGPSNTLDALERHAVLNQMSSTTKRAPSRVR